MHQVPRQHRPQGREQAQPRRSPGRELEHVARLRFTGQEANKTMIDRGHLACPVPTRHATASTSMLPDAWSRRSASPSLSDTRRQSRRLISEDHINREHHQHAASPPCP